MINQSQPLLCDAMQLEKSLDTPDVKEYLRRYCMVRALCHRPAKDSSADRTPLSGLSPVHVTR